MKLLVVLSLVCCTLAAPQQYYKSRPQAYSPQQQPQYSANAVVPITSYKNTVNPDGSYEYSYSTGDGTQAQESGYLKNAGNKDLEAQTVQGSYSYVSPDGTPITVTYIADENGFRAEGAHLPTPPPIPEAIARSLQLIAKTQPVSPSFNQQYNQYSRF